MTGTGKINDPYIPDNWRDFVTAVGDPGAFVEFPEGGGNIDLNDYAPTGISTVEINCASIKGNGWTISNLYCAGQNAFKLPYGRSVDISELHFLDMNLQDQGKLLACFDSGAYVNQYAFTRCSFSGIISGSYPSSSYVFTSQTQLRQCSINIRCNGTAAIIYSDGYTTNTEIFEFCRIRLSGDSANMIYNANFVNCYFEGSSADTELYVTKRSSTNYNIFNVDFKAASAFKCTGNSGAVNLINTDLLPLGAVIGTGFVGVTTNQLHDAAHLASLGFPIGVD